MSHRPGGGYDSNKHIEKPQPHTRPKSQAVNPKAVAQIGAATAYTKDTFFQGRTLKPVGPTDNQIEGPGSGRQVHAHGSQSGLVTRQMPEGVDILGSFGPEIDR